MEDIFHSAWMQAGATGILVLVLVLIVKKIYADMRRDKLAQEVKEAAHAVVVTERENARLLEESRQRLALENRLKHVETTNVDILTKVVVDNTAAQHANAMSRRDLDTTLRLMVETLNNLPCNARLPNAQLPTRFPTPLPPNTP